MIIRLVKFKSALSDSEVLKLYQQRASQYRKLPGQEKQSHLHRRQGMPKKYMATPMNS